MSGALIDRIDLGNTHFRRQLKKLDRVRLAEVHERIAMLPGQAQLPDKLHVHRAINRAVASALDASKKVPAWTMHATNDDSTKASFTLENGTAYFRRLASHAEIDRDP
jgi:predicted metal-dependent hydrolase